MKAMFTVLALLVFPSCSKTTEPITTLGYELEIVHSSSISISWDTTFYQHDTSWNGFDSAAADSFANILSNSGLGVTDFWYPQSSVECLIILIPGSEVIVKLEKPNPAAGSVHLQMGTGFPLACVPFWRHYKYTKE
jgi:hypothetical protein